MAYKVVLIGFGVITIYCCGISLGYLLWTKLDRKRKGGEE